MVAPSTPDCVAGEHPCSRLHSLPSDVLLLGLLTDPDRVVVEPDCFPLEQARAMSPTEKYAWVRGLDAETKSRLIARYLYGVV